MFFRRVYRDPCYRRTGCFGPNTRVVNNINANMSSYMFTSTCSTVSVTSRTPEMHSRGCSHRCTSIRCARAHFLSLSPSILWLRVFSPGGRSTSPLTCRATHVCRVRLQSYAPTVALRHSCLFLSLREPLSPSLLVHSATRRPTAAHQPSPPLSTTVLAEPQISPSLRSRRAARACAAGGRRASLPPPRRPRERWRPPRAR